MSSELPGRGPLLLVTRPAAQGEPWVSKLRARGVRAEALPLIDIGPAPDANAVRRMWDELKAGALVMFVSPSAVEQGFLASGREATWPRGVQAAATGPGTVKALRAAGVPDDHIVAPPEDAPRFDSEALWQCLASQDWAGRAVWVVRGEGGRDWFADTLRRAGGVVQCVQGYTRSTPVLSVAQSELLRRALQVPLDVCWLFSSSESVDHLDRLVPGADWSASAALATHPRIAERVRELGMRDVRTVAPSVEAVVEALASGA